MTYDGIETAPLPDLFILRSNPAVNRLPDSTLLQPVTDLPAPAPQYRECRNTAVSKMRVY